MAHTNKGWIPKVLIYFLSHFFFVNSALKPEKFFLQDSELQAWILDLHDNGYPIREGESDHGIPSSVKTAAQLSHLLTITIFTSSCQHAAVNFSQMDTYGFVPNSPLLMRQPPPTQKGKVTEKDIMHCLPNNDQAGFTVLTMFDLTRFFPDVVSSSQHIRDLQIAVRGRLRVRVFRTAHAL